MQLTMKAALVGLTLSVMPLAAAQAETHVSINLGDVAFAYTDGYWDRDHHWHRWHHSDWERYRHEHSEHAYNYRHDHDHDHGWREHDRYWDHG